MAVVSYSQYYAETELLRATTLARLYALRSSTPITLPGAPISSILPTWPAFNPCAPVQQLQQGIPELSSDAWDNVALNVYSSASGVTVRFLGEYQLANGSVQHFSRDVVPTSDRVVNSTVVELPVSKLLSMTAMLAVGSAQRGQVYVRAQAQRSVDAAATRVATLLSGYVSNAFAPSWPGGLLEDNVAGRGMLRSVTGTDPAAGSEVSQTVPTGARWRLWGMTSRLVTSATVATRRAHYELTDGTNRILIMHPEKTQAASATNDYVWATQMAIVDATTNVNSLGLPPEIPLLAGWVINTVTTNIQAGDNWGAPQMLVEEWLEP